MHRHHFVGKVYPLALIAILFFVAISIVSVKNITPTEQTAQLVTSGLVAYYSFDDGTATDGSGNGRHGTVQGATQATGRVGNALSFDGTNDYVDISAIDGTICDSDESVAMWFRTNTSGQQQQLFSYANIEDFHVKTGIHMESDGRLMFFKHMNNNPKLELASSLSYNDGNWHHVAVVRSGSSFTLYVDGQSVNSTTITTGAWCGGSDSRVGVSLTSADSGNPRLYFAGSLDEIYVFNRGISSSEISTIYNNTGGTPPPSGAECGNSVVESGEVCDGNTTQCTALSGSYTGGTATCNSECSGWVTTSCTSSTSDTTNPTVSITSPTNGATLNNTVTLQATASDNVSVQSVAFRIDGVTVHTDTSAPYTYSLNTTLYSNGSHSITALATDASGNTASNQINVTIDNQVVSPPTGGTTIDLGDLTIPRSRVPAWQPLDHLPLSTSGWTTTNVPCGTGSTIQNAINVAGPNTVLQLAASCTYTIPQQLNFNRSRVVLRGAGPSTILEFTHTDQQGIEFGTGSTVFGDARSWTGGYTLGTRVLTLSSTSGLSVGQWVRLRANNEPDWHSNARNGYVAKLSCVGPTGSDSCSGLSSNQVKLDRGLMGLHNQGGQVLERMTGSPVQYSGIENLRIQHSDPGSIVRYRPRINMQNCYECWIVNNSFGDAGNQHINMVDSTRVAIRGNSFGSNHCLRREGTVCSWNKGTVYFNEYSFDNVFENNYIIDTPSGPLIQNGGGNIVAYNYMDSNPSVACERHVFLHGQGVRSTLIEGNDVDCMIQWDSVRDGQGHYNTMYRNRLRGTPQTGSSFGGFYRGRLGPEDTGSHIHRFITVIGNYANELMGGPQPTGRAIDESNDATHRHEDTWVSYNIAKSNIIFENSGAQVRTTNIQNHVRSSAPSSWSTIDFPESLYRASTPSWWCQESGSFPNIGALSDGPSSLSRLPAQIRAEGGTCTPVGGGPTGPYCGDGACNGAETCSSCSGDCGVCPPTGLSLNLQPRLESRTISSSDSFTISIFSPGGSSPLISFTNSGSTIALPANTLSSGPYDIEVSSSGHLTRRSTHTLNTSTVTLPELLAGDLNNDNVINSLDWSLMSPQWFTNNTQSDLNRDGTVNSIDFSYLNKNWGLQGD